MQKKVLIAVLVAGFLASVPATHAGGLFGKGGFLDKTARSIGDTGRAIDRSRRSSWKNAGRDIRNYGRIGRNNEMFRFSRSVNRRVFSPIRRDIRRGPGRNNDIYGRDGWLRSRFR